MCTQVRQFISLSLLTKIVIVTIGFGPLLPISMAKRNEATTHKMSRIAKPTQYNSSAFKPDPQYQEQAYDPQAQRDIYGKKRAVNTTRPMLELGRPYLRVGAYEPGLPLRFMVYGDLQTGVGMNSRGDESQQLLGLRANLDLDLKITSTERVHALIRPLDTGNQPSQIRLDQEDNDDGIVHIYQRCLESDCTTLESFDELFGNLFLEGEVSNLPIALGKIPHLLQNGVWLYDAYIG